MSDDSLALLSEADKLARVADAVSERYAFELSAVLRDLERALRTLVVDALAGSRTALSRAVRAAKLRRQVQVALKAAGYEALAEKATMRGLDALILQMERLRLASKLAAFTESDFSRMLALRELARLDLLGQGQTIALALWRTLARGLFSQRPQAALLEDLSDTIDREQSEARTLYDTTVSIFGRQVEAMKARDGDIYAYVGPLDIKTRPFCFEHVGKVYTKAEIDGMDNGQLPNVFLTGGGYNCRHVFQAVSKVSELRNLVGTNQRMPEVERLALRMGDRKAA